MTSANLLAGGVRDGQFLWYVHATARAREGGAIRSGDRLNEHKGPVMNEQKLIDAVAAATGGSNAATSEAVDAYIASVTDAVTTGDSDPADRLRFVLHRNA